MVSKIKFSIFACLIAAGALVSGCTGEVISGGNFDEETPNTDNNPSGDTGETPDDGNGNDGNGNDGNENDGNENQDPPENSKCTSPDKDGDTISDEFEECAKSVDTDDDTIPDCEDEDSDNDTIPDRLEAGTGGCSGEASEDADNDFTPNFRDLDSDDNGILDANEGDPASDIDGDTIPDFLDDDDDGDSIFDIAEIIGISNYRDSNLPGDSFSGDCNGDNIYDLAGSPDAPVDCDSDGIPDYKDTDSDGDTMSDRLEGNYINGVFYARYSQDSDGNGVSDANEAGNGSSPIDTDGDGTPDFLDNDNDNDGLPDKYEDSIGSNPNLEDSDNDGASDLVEVGAGTSPTDPAVNPISEGNFVFVVPYKKEATPKKQTLSFATAIQTIDIFFAFDQSASMYDEVASLKAELKNIITKLKCREFGKSCSENNDCIEFGDAICSELGECIQNPGSGEGCFDNMWTGLGYYEKADSFWVASHLNSDASKTVNALARFDDAGNSEAAYQAPICALLGKTNPELCKSNGSYNCASGSYSSNCEMNCTTDKSKVGCVGYRNNAIRIFAHAFDENQCYYYNSSHKTRCMNFKDQVGTIMQQYKTRYIGLYSTEYTSTNDGGISNMEVSADIGRKSKSVDSSNNPFIYKAMDADLASKAVEGIKQIAGNMPIQVTTTAEDIDKDASKLVAGLNVNIVDAGTEVQGKICETIDASTIQSGKFQGISNLMPGKVVCYDVIPLDHQDMFKPTDEPLVLKARIKVMGDGSVLNSGIAYFVVPPVFEGSEIN